MATESLKIFVVSSYLKTMGGAEKNVLDLCRGLKDRCTIEAAGLQCGEVLEQVRATGVAAHDLGVRALLSTHSLRRGLWFWRKLRDERFDVVVTYHHDADIWAGLLAFLAGVPVVSSRRDMGFMLSPGKVWIYRLINRLFRKIITVSDAVRREIIRAQWAPGDRIVVVHNGISVEHVDVDGATVRRELGLHPTHRLVVTVANFRPIKGQDVLVRAAADVCRLRDDVDFVVIGSKQSAYYLTIKELVRDLGLESRFHCVGDRSDVQRLLPAFDVFALPSLQEGFSNALVEAMAVGLPPVATDVGGNPEAVEHGRNGFLFPSGDHRALARHLVTLLGDDALRGRMGAAARATVLAGFSFDGMIDRAHDVFAEATR